MARLQRLSRLLPVGWTARRPAIPSVVLVAWLSSRLFVDLILASGTLHHGQPLAQVFSNWDGNWYLRIASEGYSAAAASSGPMAGQTTYPFFPLLPLGLGLLSRFGLPPIAGGLLIGHLCLLVGLVLTHRLVNDLCGRSAADWTCWFLAFSPGSLAYSMLYPEGLLLVFSSGAFLARSQGRTALAGALAALATLTRPNGLVVSIALGTEALLLGRGRRAALQLLAPSLLVLLVWSACLMAISGNALIWMGAKQAWQEQTLLNLFAGGGDLSWSQLLAGIVAMTVLLLGWSSQPISWRAFGLLWIAPSFLLGMVGFPRYAGACFPVLAALGERVARLTAALRWLLLAGSAGLLALQTVQVGVLQRWTP